MSSTGMRRHVALVRNGVSEERINAITWVKRIRELGTTLAVEARPTRRHMQKTAYCMEIVRFKTIPSRVGIKITVEQ
jgi:hypothetical protein